MTPCISILTLLSIILLNMVNSQDVTCNTMDDCSYNGICKNNICECFPQWKGGHCASLNIIAGSKNAGLQSKVNGSRATTYDDIKYIVNTNKYMQKDLIHNSEPKTDS